MDIPLQPLRIPSGWSIEHNQGLYECDPLVDHIPEEDRSWLFKEDMLQMKHRQHNRILDLGWYPAGDLTEGAFKLVVYEGDFLGGCLYEFQAQDRHSIVMEIERLLVLINNGEL